MRWLVSHANCSVKVPWNAESRAFPEGKWPGYSGQMTKPDHGNTSSNPPTWRWNRPESQGAPARTARRAAGAPPLLWPSWRDMRRPLWLEAKYVGGPEGDVVIKVRGWRFVFPADTPIYDVIRTINVGKEAMVRREDQR